MPEPITKLQRWLDLIAFLLGRSLPVTVEDLMERVPAYAQRWNTGDEKDRSAARRMFERDKEELRRYGIPLRTIRYHINFGLDEAEGYVIDRRNFYLPYLRLVGEASSGTAPGAAPPGHGREGALDLEPREAALALDALRRVVRVPGFPLAREAASAFRKLAFDLDPAAFSGAPVLFVERPGAAELTERLRHLSDALLLRKRVIFRYHGIYRGEPTDRDVAPYGLLFQHGHWYLIGHDAVRDAIRVFRVGRMEDVRRNARNPNTPDFEVPADFRLDDYAGREAWELGDEQEAALRARVGFTFPASLWAERNGYGALEETEADGAQVRAFEVHQVAPFLRWILSQEGDAVILDPPELVAAFAELARETAAVYRQEADR